MNRIHRTYSFLAVPAFVLPLAFAHTPALAQLQIGWATIDAGGGYSQGVVGGGVVVSVAGTIGQWDAAAVYSLTQSSAGGYWSALTFDTSCAGDFDFDHDVDDNDFVIFAQQYDAFACSDLAMPWACLADLNHDAIVDDTDFVYFAQAYELFTCP